MIRIEEYRKNAYNKYIIHNITVFTPRHIQSGKFDKMTQHNFDELLKALNDDHHIKIHKE